MGLNFAFMFLERAHDGKQSYRHRQYITERGLVVAA